MRRNCTECRHWWIEYAHGDCEFGCDKDIWKVAQVLTTQLEGFPAGEGGLWGDKRGTAMFRRLFRTATDCPEYEPVEPVAEDCTCGIDRQQVGGAYEPTQYDAEGYALFPMGSSTKVRRVVDPKCRLHGDKR